MNAKYSRAKRRGTKCTREVLPELQWRAVTLASQPAALKIEAEV